MPGLGLHVTQAIERLKNNLLELSSLVEEQVQKAVISLEKQDREISREVISKDTIVDNCEIEIEEQCLQILALYQPVALDLRFVIAALKMNNDLERIADLACNISERVISLSNNWPENSGVNFSEMAEKSQTMLRNSLDSLIKIDPVLAQKVCDADLEVDELHSNNYKIINNAIMKNVENTMSLIQLLSISRYFERIADLATNIAEDVIYLASGKIVRHRS